jgi:hypothetical protein
VGHWNASGPRARATSRTAGRPAAVPRCTRTSRPTRAQWTVRRAPWCLSMTSVVPGQATRRSPIGRTAGTALRHWWTDAARHRPLPSYSVHAAAHTAAWLPWRARKHPHRLVPVYKSRSLLPRASPRAAAAIGVPSMSSSVFSLPLPPVYPEPFSTRQ